MLMSRAPIGTREGPRWIEEEPVALSAVVEC
jgi:hypothetical protein